MKKRISLLVALSLSIIIFVGCGNKKSDDTIVIGVSPNPHEEIVNLIKEDLKSEGINLETKIFTDYINPNLALDGKEIDLNFFQHQPYLDDFVKERNLDLTSIGSVHIEPMALYSKKFKSIKDLSDGATIAIPNDAVNGGRALLLLEANNIIEINPKAGLNALPKDITKNPKNLKFKTLDAPVLPAILGEVDAAVINGNYALDNGLNPLKEGIIIEDKDSPYANIVAIRTEDSDREDLQTIMKYLNSDKIREYIINKYDGAIVPAF